MYGKSPCWKRLLYHNIWLRSSYELNFAQYLDSKNIKWEYEIKRFNLGNKTYTPDFYLPEINQYIEIKGWWKKEVLNKFLAFKLLYPEIKIKVLMQEDLKTIGVL